VAPLGVSNPCCRDENPELLFLQYSTGFPEYRLDFIDNSNSSKVRVLYFKKRALR
jgi:hypothetical protein